MKKLTMVAVLCCLTISLWSENEFSKDSTQWFIHDSWDSFFGGDWGDNFYQYQLDGDTLIDNQICKKLFLNDVYHGAVSAEGKVIWYWTYDEEKKETIKTLFYDFSKEEGNIIHFDYQIYLYDDLSIAIRKEAYDLTVLKVRYQYGRKIMELSNYDIWIEGIGSILGFWGIDHMVATNGISHSLSLTQVVADKQSIYMASQLVNPDYTGTFLTEGKTWYLDNGNQFERITLNAPTFDKHYLRYPVRSSKWEELGYLYDVNGTIYWDYFKKGMPLYNFNLFEGNKIHLYTSYFAHPLVNRPLKTEAYTVSKVDQIESEGKMLKRIFLDGPAPYIWIENIGSTTGLFYMPRTIGDKTAIATTCCYADNELIYHNTYYPDCETRPGSQIDCLPQKIYEIKDNKLIINNHIGQQLIIYNINGKVVCNKMIRSIRDVTSLTGISKSVLLCKLMKGTTTEDTFKIIIP